MKLKYAFLFVGMLSVSACDGDEQSFLPTKTSESAEWRVLVDGDEVTGVNIQIKETEEQGIFLKASNADGTNGVAFFFNNKPAVSTYELGGTGMLTFARYFMPSDTVNVNTGELNITKYDADSLVADFHFNTYITDDTPALSLTGGKIKARFR